VRVLTTLYSTACQRGCGTFFSVTTSGKEHVIYSFKGGQDVSQPGYLLSYKGLFYGVGSAGNCEQCGTAFSITTSGHEALLHGFSGGDEGENPRQTLTVLNGTLYGTTANGGNANLGTVFTLNP
jgi:uncharacterized repeat protein (TIGR03803 family)